MGKMFRNIAIVGSLIGIGLTASGCSVVSTAPDMVAIRYKAGALSSTTFDDCVPISTRETSGPGDLSYTYPANVRSYNARLVDKAETGPIRVLSKDGSEMDIPVQIDFTLDTDCKMIRKFHENYGLNHRAYWQGSDFNDDMDTNKDGTPDGWVKVLNMYIGSSLDVTLDRTAQEYEWRDLWNNPDVKAELDQVVEAELQRRVDERMGGSYFKITTSTVMKPELVSEGQKAALDKERVAIANANAVAEEARAKEIASGAEIKAADANAKVAQAKAVATKAEIDSMGNDTWLKMKGMEKGHNPWPAPIVE